jgi:hypothetical protein
MRLAPTVSAENANKTDLLPIEAMADALCGARHHRTSDGLSRLKRLPVLAQRDR